MFSAPCFLYGWDWDPFGKKEISTLFTRRDWFSLDVPLICWVGNLEFLGLSTEIKNVILKAFLWFLKILYTLLFLFFFSNQFPFFQWTSAAHMSVPVFHSALYIVFLRSFQLSLSIWIIWPTFWTNSSMSHSFILWVGKVIFPFYLKCSHDPLLLLEKTDLIMHTFLHPIFPSSQATSVKPSITRIRPCRYAPRWMWTILGTAESLPQPLEE